MEILVSPHTFARGLTRDAGTGTPAKEPDLWRGAAEMRFPFLLPPLSDDGGGFAVFLTLFRNTNSGRYKNNNCGPNNNTCKLPRNKSKDQI